MGTSLRTANVLINRSQRRCRASPCSKIATWVVEGLNLKEGTKLEALEVWMIGAILSGKEGSLRTFAGVGFMIAPHVRQSVTGFLQYSDRLASMRLRVPGGQLCLISVYAPTDTKDYSYEYRRSFHDEVQDFILSQRVHGPTFVLGDFNARLHLRRSSEESCLGPGVFGNPSKVLEPTSNRELLLETCQAMESVLINTFFQHDACKMVTYRGFGVGAMDAITHQNFAQLDHILVPHAWTHAVSDVYTDRDAALQSQHFLLVMELSLEIPMLPKKSQAPQPALSTLRDRSTRAQFCDAFLKKKMSVSLSSDVTRRPRCSLQQWPMQWAMLRLTFRGRVCSPAGHG